MPIKLVHLGITGLLAACNLLQANELPTCPARPIRFAHYEAGALYSNGVGIDKDLLDEMIRRSGCAVTLEVLPRARIWLELEHGTLDMAASAVQTAARDKFAWFTPYFIAGYQVLLKDVPQSIDSMDQFMAAKSLRLGVVRSYKYSPYLDEYLIKLAANNQLVEAVDTGMLFRMFETGRVQAVLAFTFDYPYYLKQNYLEGKGRVEAWDPSAGVKQGIVMSKHSFDEEQARRWTQLVDDIRKDGALERILLKYMSQEDVSKMLDF